MVKPKAIDFNGNSVTMGRQIRDNVDALWNAMDLLGLSVDTLTSRVDTINKNLDVISRNISE